MEKLQILKYSIRKDSSLNFTEGMSWATELTEIEELQKNAAPNEVFSYYKSLEIEDDDGDHDWEDEEEDEDEELADDDDEDNNDDDVRYPEEENYEYDDDDM